MAQVLEVLGHLEKETGVKGALKVLWDCRVMPVFGFLRQKKGFILCSSGMRVLQGSKDDSGSVR